MLVWRLASTLLQLQQQTWVLHLDKIVHIPQTRLHQGHLTFDCVVPVSDAFADCVFVAGHEVGRKQLYEFVLHVLDEVEFRTAVFVHNEHSEEAVRLFDAAVDHLNQHICVVRELDH